MLIGIHNKTINWFGKTYMVSLHIQTLKHLHIYKFSMSERGN